jgi:SAM-dependent methyltransferase
LKEEDIRKRDVLNRYLELVGEDCEIFFRERAGYTQSACPACASESATPQFEKNGFEYAQCRQCRTLFVLNRPPYEKLVDFYTASQSTAFWIRDFFLPMAEARRQAIFRPRADYIAGRFGTDPGWTIGDIGAGFGLFLEEMRVLWPRCRYVAIEPSPEQAGICSKAGLAAECSTIEALSGYDARFDLLTAYELLEHLSDLRQFTEAVFRLLKPGGWFFMTTLNGEGFDIQVLWEKAKAVTPPHHLNFLNPESLEQMLVRAGFEVPSVETPGKLDWDIVEGMIRHEEANPGRFWTLLAQQGTAEGKREFQEWLSRNRLSSHMRVLARKPL